MSRSFRTQKESVLAQQRMKKEKNGEIILPRVIKRKPAFGDVHPIPKKELKGILKNLPIEYVYGLSRIELRARNSEVGQPFGYYAGDEKAIIQFPQITA